MKDPLTYQIIGIAMRVHSQLGRGLLERAYAVVLEQELIAAGLRVEREKPYPLVYKGEVLNERAFVADLVVEGAVIIEAKCTKTLKDEHVFQLLTYLKMADLERGLLINFNTKSLKNGIRRVSLSTRDSTKVD